MRIIISIPRRDYQVGNVKSDNLGRKLPFVVFMILAAICLIGTTVRADMGMKPSIHLKINNAPAEYYVALLAESGNDSVPDSKLWVDEVNDEFVEAYLRDFSYEGWRYYVPFGLNFLCHSDESGSYYFSYSVPNPFRVAVISETGQVYISNALNQKEYNASCVYDISTGILKEKRGGRIAYRLLGIIVCYCLTLFFEWCVFGSFKFPPSKVNIFNFFLINTITQLSLNIFIFNVVPGLGTVIMLLFMEIIITIVEGIYYCFVLRDSDDNLIGGMSFLYAICANALSAFMGDIFISLYFELADIF